MNASTEPNVSNEPGRVKRLFTGSVARKYSLGYFILLLAVLLVFAASAAGISIISGRYQRTLDGLLDINELFVRVESTNSQLYSYYLYMENNGEKYRECVQETRAHVQRLLETAGDSRETTDLCYTVNTYIERSDELAALLDRYFADSGSVPVSQLEAAYAGTQEIITYINSSFQRIYTIKLETARLMRQQVLRTTTLVVALQTVTLVLAVAVAVTFYRLIVTGAAKSLKKLTDFTQSVSKNPKSTGHVDIDTDDEFQVFACTYNDMLDTIHEQVSQLERDSHIREQLQKAEMEKLRVQNALQQSQYKLLQGRINPHFLYNTLNMIQQTAYIEDARDTLELIEAMSGFLRYNLSRLDADGTLREEIEALKEYAFIQKARFGSRVSFEYDVDPDCLQARIPCMALQPLMENSFTHGISSYASGARIKVLARLEEGRVHFGVQDNGSGITQETIERIVKSAELSAESGEHIGIKNVYTRLKLYFAGDAKLIIDGSPGRTSVCFEVPYKQ